MTMLVLPLLEKTKREEIGKKYVKYSHNSVNIDTVQAMKRSIIVYVDYYGLLIGRVKVFIIEHKGLKILLKRK